MRPSRLVSFTVASIVGLLGACVVAELLTTKPPAPAPKLLPASSAPAPEEHDFAAFARKHPGLPPGSEAPDFRLPDRDGHFHSLAEFRGRRTLLLFLCGCSRCEMMVKAVKEIEHQAQGEKPQHLTVMTIIPQNLQSWKERTGYQGTFLFDNGKKTPVVRRYDGAPCPRLYILDPALRVEYVSPTPDAVAQPADVLVPLAKALHSTWTPSAPPPGPSS